MTFGHNGVHILITPMTNERNILSKLSSESWHESECIPLLVSRSLNFKNKQDYELGQGPCVPTGNMRMFLQISPLPNMRMGKWGRISFFGLFGARWIKSVCVCVCVCVCARLSPIHAQKSYNWGHKKLNLTNYQYLVTSMDKGPRGLKAHYWA